MNPIGIFFSLAARQADIRRGFAIWESVKPKMTELLDLVRSIGADTGLLSPETLQRLGPSRVPEPLKQYTSEWIQRSLNKVIGADLRVDGDIDGPKTREAVRKFQKKHELKVDGFPGVQTTAVLAQEVGKVERI